VVPVNHYQIGYDYCQLWQIVKNKRRWTTPGSGTTYKVRGTCILALGAGGL